MLFENTSRYCQFWGFKVAVEINNLDNLIVPVDNNHIVCFI